MRAKLVLIAIVGASLTLSSEWMASADPPPLTPSLAAESGEEPGEVVDRVVKEFDALGYNYDAKTRQFLIRLPRDSGEAANLTHRLSNVGVAASIVLSDFTQSELADVRAKLAARAWHSQAHEFVYAIHYDAQKDKVTLRSTAPRHVDRPLFSELGEVIDYRPASYGQRESRNNDGAPHKGGVHITRTPGLNGCSSGFAVARNGVRYLVTAAHCYAAGGVQLYDFSGAHNVAVTSTRSNFPTYDNMLIGGRSYSRDIYTGGATGLPYPVISAANPTVTGSYCRSGWRTLERCGLEVGDLNATLCDIDGCTPGLAAYTGYDSQGGDSGAPFYAKFNDPDSVKIRGIHIGRMDNVMYAEKWSAIQSHLGVTIVTTPL